MPYLDDLTPDLFTVNRSRLTLARIENWMFYPDDPLRRQKAYEAADAEFLRQSIDQKVAVAGPEVPLPDFTIGDLQKIVAQAVTAPRIGDMQQSAKVPLIQGMAAGLIVFEVIANSKVKPRMAGMTRAKERAVAMLGNRDEVKISMKTIDNQIWRRFRPVGHLWGAYIAQCVRGDVVFPCHLDRVELFLAEAEYMRKEGEKLKPAQTKERLLRARDTLRVPSTIELPDIDVDWVDTKSSSAQGKGF